MNYGTNKLLNIVGSLGLFLDHCAELPCQKFFCVGEPGIEAQRLANTFYLSYTVHLLAAKGFEQRTRMNFYAVYLADPDVPLAARQHWTMTCIDACRVHFETYAPQLFDFAALCPDTGWAEFLRTGLFTTLEAYFETAPAQIGDILFHVAEWGEATTSEYENRVETAWSLELVHMAVDNIQQGGILL